MYIREPFVAGRFYTRNPEELLNDVTNYIENSEKQKIDNICVIVSPHAGYIYSGAVAGHAYRQVTDKKVHSVIVMAPSHYERFPGISVLPDGLYRTPLGDMEIDSTITSELLKSNDFTFFESAHIPEHSLEVQVPFIQKTFPSAKIVPLILSESSLDLMKRTGEYIADVVRSLKKEVLLVISTDLSHFHTYNDARSRDKRMIDTFTAGDPVQLKRVLNEGYATACGEAPLLAGLYFAHALGKIRIHLLKYANSGDVTSDKSRVVGYMAAAISLVEEE